MSAVHCQLFPDCMRLHPGNEMPSCERQDCPGAAERRRASEFTSALFARPEPDPLSRFDSLLCAYGYLWLFQGDAYRDPNAGFAFEARWQLKSVLTKDQQSRGIEIARNLAKANGLPFTEPVG